MSSTSEEAPLVRGLLIHRDREAADDFLRAMEAGGESLCLQWDEQPDFPPPQSPSPPGDVPEVVVIVHPPSDPFPSHWIRAWVAEQALSSVIVVLSHMDETAEQEAFEAGASFVLARNHSSPARLPLAVRRALGEVERRKHLERERIWFRTLTENVSETLILCDLAGTIQYVSPQGGEMLGGEPEGFLGRNLFDFIHPDDRPRALADFWAVTEEVSLEGPTEVRILRPDGVERVVSGSGRNLFRSPAVKGLTITIRDVTDQRALEERLRQSQKMEAVARLAGGIAHEFNNLLTVILGHTEILLEDDTPREETRSGLREIQNGAERAAVLTRQLLALSRPIEVARAPVDLAEVVRGMREVIESLFGSPSALVLHLPTPAWTRADRGHLEEVLLHLTLNAREAMPQGGRLQIEVASIDGPARGGLGIEPTPWPGPWAILTVRDSGVGMEESVRSRIFDPFFSTKTQVFGAGMGLSVVYGIVRQLHGHIRVESQPGVGTCFQIWLPQIDPSGGDSRSAMTSSSVS